MTINKFIPNVRSLQFHWHTRWTEYDVSKFGSKVEVPKLGYKILTERVRRESAWFHLKHKNIFLFVR
ncbi:hypothetical protein EG68_07475 [Paragonimus skrjabini miyazakii]|uniref:Uncharacterized protein n=1 Tax=Paragonimus skrjabini miyazakii TaxID=59628 RepID=A0A8S9YPJ7_9TREM|nr:hypothetical protein EG68_07475 [Paragonimus skrjabini miyazakii]